MVITGCVADSDANQQIEKGSESEPIERDDAGKADDLTRKRQEAKKALRPELPSGDPTDAPKP